MTHCFQIKPETEADTPQIWALHKEAFGPGRFSRTAFRIREKAQRAPQISLTAWYETRLAGAVQFTAIKIGGRSGAMLLGPLAIAPAFKNMGCGVKLMNEGVAIAVSKGYEFVILIGDLSYYKRAGFEMVPPGRIVLPGPADPARVLGLALRDGAQDRFAGLAEPDNPE